MTSRLGARGIGPSIGSIGRIASSRGRAIAAGALVAIAGVAHAGVAHGQTAGRIGVSVGYRWSGGMFTRAVDATETSPTSARFRLFSAETSLLSCSGADLAVGVRLAPSIEAEIAAGLGATDLRTRLGSDAEGVADAEAVETVSQVTIEASILAYVPRWRLFGRATPFATGGGGYLRHLHEGRTLIEEGSIYHAGGGLVVPLRSGGTGRLKAAGLRLDARAVVRVGGAAFDERAHVAPALGVSWFARF